MDTVLERIAFFQQQLKNPDFRQSPMMRTRELIKLAFDRANELTSSIQSAPISNVFHQKIQEARSNDALDKDPYHLAAAEALKVYRTAYKNGSTVADRKLARRYFEFVDLAKELSAPSERPFNPRFLHLRSDVTEQEFSRFLKKFEIIHTYDVSRSPSLLARVGGLLTSSSSENRELKEFFSQPAI